MTEREHCQEVAGLWFTDGNPWLQDSSTTLTNLIARERAAARAEALEEAISAMCRWAGPPGTQCRALACNCADVRALKEKP